VFSLGLSFSEPAFVVYQYSIRVANCIHLFQGSRCALMNGTFIDKITNTSTSEPTTHSYGKYIALEVTCMHEITLCVLGRDDIHNLIHII
jgi:hypothetical protein